MMLALVLNPGIINGLIINKMITPRSYQTEAFYAILDYFNSGKRGNPLVVAPTGSGKSIIISLFCFHVSRLWSTQKILIVSHTKEILSQDYRAIMKHLPTTKIGLYSAGLKSKTIENITVAGIQSIYNKPELFEKFNIIIVDEAHTISHNKNGMYRKFFDQVKKPVIGFTATPFRLGYGYLHIGKDKFFDEIVYNIPIKTLQDQGHLCKLSAKGTQTRLNADGIRKQSSYNKDYVIKELSLAFDRERITKYIISELLLYQKVRKKWLLFTIDISHCENVTKQLIKMGIKAAYVHSKMNGNRDQVIKDFKAGKYQALVSVAVLTVGFDAPDVDLIGLLRPTASPVLHIQIIGRGLRPYPGKENCLVLDFSGNLLRNGPIDAPIIKLKGDGTGEAIMKECDHCYEIVHAAVRICPCCKKPFEFKHHLTATAKDREVLSLSEWHEVTETKYFNYVGKKNIPMLKVSYICGLRKFNEYVCLEHEGYAKIKARHWWSNRSTIRPPDSASQAHALSNTLKEPKKIFVDEGGKFPTIKDHEF